MTKVTKAVIAGGVCLTAAIFAQTKQAPDPLNSLTVCADTQKLIVENQFVRVIDDIIPVGAVEKMHRHRHGVVVYLTDYTVDITTQDGKKTTAPRKANTATWSDATIHTVNNTGKTPSHAIRIELKF
jgi:hypothetical protein